MTIFINKNLVVLFNLKWFNDYMAKKKTELRKFKNFFRYCCRLYYDYCNIFLILRCTIVVKRYIINLVLTSRE
jgi:hypothetical protein